MEASGEFRVDLGIFVARRLKGDSTLQLHSSDEETQSVCSLLINLEGFADQDVVDKRDHLNSHHLEGVCGGKCCRKIVLLDSFGGSSIHEGVVGGVFDKNDREFTFP